MNGRNLLSVSAALVLLILGLSLTAAGAQIIDLAPPPSTSPEKILEMPRIAGGSDPFGYTYAASNEPGGPMFDWLDIRDGTALGLSDGGTAVVTMPFTFTLYGLRSQSVTISNEGVLLLGARDISVMGENEPLSTTLLTDLIAPFWDDLSYRQSGTYYKTLGAAPNRRFVVEWYDRPHDPDDGTLATATFEVVLYEGKNNIKFQYQDTEFGNQEWDNGASATAGIGHDGSSYLQYAYNQGILFPDMAICFQYPDSPACDEPWPPQIGVSPAKISATQFAGEVTTHALTIANTGEDDLTFALEEISPSIQGIAGDVDWVAEWPEIGTISGGDSLQVSVVFTAPEEVYGIYPAALSISSNDPSSSFLTLPLTMTVLLSPSLSITKRPNAERVTTGSLLTYTLVVSNAGGPVSSVSVSDTLPPATLLAWIGDGGTGAGDDVVWKGLDLPRDARQVLSYAITVTCVPTGSEIVNAKYQVLAPGWPPVQGQPITVTAMVEVVAAAFEVAGPVVQLEPVSFTNHSLGATSFLWAFGDGLTSTLPSPIHTYSQQGSYTAVLTASNVCSADVYSRALSVEEFALDLVPQQAVGQAAPGQEVVYILSLTNVGTLSDTFVLALGSHLWDTALSTVEVGPLAAGSASAFQVLVRVPADARPGEQDGVVVQAVSNADPRQSPAQATSLLTTTAGPYARYLPLVVR
jgi:uncharacterized repeat protein (TIGR01451 family)